LKNAEYKPSPFPILVFELALVLEAVILGKVDVPGLPSAVRLATFELRSVFFPDTNIEISHPAALALALGDQTKVDEINVSTNKAETRTSRRLNDIQQS
jgi:hypothetical protein